MKKVLLALLVGLLSGPVLADNLWRSSFTATNDTAQKITGAVSLNGVVVSSASVAGATLLIYDSLSSANNLIARVSLTSLGDYTFNVKLSSGLVYTTSNNNMGVTIIYGK